MSLSASGRGAVRGGRRGGGRGGRHLVSGWRKISSCSFGEDDRTHCSAGGAVSLWEVRVYNMHVFFCLDVQFILIRIKHSSSHCVLLLSVSRHLTLSQSDMAALTGGKGFPFLFQHIRDGINIRQTCNLIFSLCRYNNRLAEHVCL